MSQYEVITFTHANLARPVKIVAGTVSGFHYSETVKATVVYTTGGVFPVVETVEEVERRFNQLANKEAKNERNGN